MTVNLPQFTSEGYLAIYRHVPRCIHCNGKLRVIKTKFKKPVARCDTCGKYIECEYVVMDDEPKGG